ncbi:MAG: aspartate kinase [Candidatus Dormibacteria bacterium]|jgi:aspartate kinase
MKFGGTLLGDADRIAANAAIVGRHVAAGGVVVVVSAMQRVTGSLLRSAAAARNRETEARREIQEELRHTHTDVCARLLPEPERVQAQDQIAATLRTSEDFCAGFSLVRELTPRALDALSSLGETLSAPLLAAVLRGTGLAAEPVDATELIVIDDRFGEASVIFEPSRQRIRERLRPILDRGAVPVVTGFRGATRDGACTTLGRGGSDYRATILAAALAADEIWIWTDVDGMMTADPQLVPRAKVIPELSYREASELSFFGAKVLHPKSLELPQRDGIPVLIKNSFAPARRGTLIDGSRQGRPGVRAIAATADAELFTVIGGQAMPFSRLAALVFSWLDADHLTTLVVTQSSAENALSFAVNNRDGARVRRRLDRERSLGEGGSVLAGIEELPEMGVVVAVGEGMRGTPGIAARIFSSLARLGINLAAIAQGSSELSVSLVVGAADLPAAVRAMHEELGL